MTPGANAPRAAALAALAGFAVTLALFYPGWMSVDAAYQYAQVLGAPRDDIHPPLMMLLWRATDALIPGPGGSTKVNLQGIIFGTNAGGRLPLEHYLTATLAERDALTRGTKSVEAVARERKLSPKYLGLLWSTLNGTAPPPPLDHIRS